MNKLKSSLTCSNCLKIFKNPIELPCEDLVCKEHLTDKEVIKQNKIKCSKCKQEFEVLGNEFKSIKFIQKQLDEQFYLSDEEITLKCELEKSIRVFYQIYDEFTLSKNKLNLECHNHFQEIRFQIDEQREKLKEKIDEIALEMIEQTKQAEALCLKSLNETLLDSLKLLEAKSTEEDLKEIEEKFREPNLLIESIQEIQMKQEKAISGIRAKLIETRHIKEKLKLNTTYEFKPNVSFNQDSFGLLKLNGLTNKDPFESQILIKNQYFELLKVCEFNQTDRFKLLYRASRDGFGSNDFHFKCDGKANTLTLFKSSGRSFIFGAFTSATWDNTSRWKSDPSAFLFSLTNKDNKPCKMKIDSNRQEYSICCDSEYGPTFGCGYDILIYSNANTNTSSYSYLGNTYKHNQYLAGTIEAKSFLAGSFNFQLDEIEVYQKVG